MATSGKSLKRVHHASTRGANDNKMPGQNSMEKILPRQSKKTLDNDPKEGPRGHAQIRADRDINDRFKQQNR